MAIDLTTWVPKFILDIAADRGGQTITHEEWNNLWNKYRECGDDTTGALFAAVGKLLETVWHPTEGADQITNPAISTDATVGLTVAAQLLWIGGLLDQLKLLLSSTATEHMQHQGFILADTLARLDDADAEVSDRIDALQLGAISAFNHNDISGRTAPDAHPISAVTGLQDQLTAINTGQTADVTNLTNHTNVNGTKHAAANISANKTGQTNQTVQTLIDQLFTAIASLTGDISTIVHNDLAARDALDTHPMTAITDLVVTLAGKQPKVLKGRTAPASALGVNDDLYVLY